MKSHVDNAAARTAAETGFRNGVLAAYNTLLQRAVSRLRLGDGTPEAKAQFDAMDPALRCLEEVYNDIIPQPPGP